MAPRCGPLVDAVGESLSNLMDSVAGSAATADAVMEGTVAVIDGDSPLEAMVEQEAIIASASVESVVGVATNWDIPG